VGKSAEVHALILSEASDPLLLSLPLLFPFENIVLTLFVLQPLQKPLVLLGDLKELLLSIILVKAL
jgi:hypothetical protein